MLRRAPALAILAILLGAQTPDREVVIRTLAYTPPSVVLRAETNLVEADVTVRDDGGHAVAGLQASEFEVFDNRVPQTIAAFSEVRSERQPATPAAPKFVTFFFDDFHMGDPGPGRQFSLLQVKQAAREFAARHLKPGDRISIATTSGAQSLDFTADAQLFAKTIDSLSFRLHTIQTPAEYHADNVTTFSALTGAARGLSEMPGAHVLVFISEGFVMHFGSGLSGRGRGGMTYDCQAEEDRFVENAVHWNVIVPVIDAKGLGAGSTKLITAMRRPLREISEGTGGYLFENSNDLSGSMELAAHPEVSYLLAFHPSVRDGKLHTLKVRLKSKQSVWLEFRPGYLSRKADDSASPAQPRDAVGEALFSKETPQDFPAKITLTSEPPKDGSIALNVVADIKGIQFADSHGRHTQQQLVFLFALLDSNGGFVTGRKSIMEFDLTDQRLASLEKGFRISGILAAPAGNYQVRTVARESSTGRLAASTTPVELRPQETPK